MGECILFGNGGSNLLNFKVVANATEPSNPKENTIWVNPPVAMTGWEMRYGEPTGNEGLVWIRTGTTSAVPFNALKKNNVAVYPLFAYQYVSGAWVSIPAKIYSDGAWKEWVQYIYNVGKINTTLTGGLKAYAYRPSSSGSSIGVPTVTLGDTYITLTEADDYAGMYSTESKANLTDVSAIKIDVSSLTVGASGSYVRLGVVSDRKDDYTPVAAKTISGKGTASLDVSELTGSYYVYIALYGNDKKTIKFTRWWLE